MKIVWQAADESCNSKRASIHCARGAGVFISLALCEVTLRERFTVRAHKPKESECFVSQFNDPGPLAARCSLLCAERLKSAELVPT